jgi:hypothetical protein
VTDSRRDLKGGEARVLIPVDDTEQPSDDPLAMPFDSGARQGPYDIVAALGEGGMGGPTPLTMMINWNRAIE